MADKKDEAMGAPPTYNDAMYPKQPGMNPGMVNPPYPPQAGVYHPPYPQQGGMAPYPTQPGQPAYPPGVGTIWFGNDNVKAGLNVIKLSFIF